VNKNSNDQFKIVVWGARGSIPCPGPQTVRYGGNTSCVEVRCGNQLIIIDAGSGLRLLGDKLLNEMPLNATILISHAHWDHIQGFPFFKPAYIKGNSFNLHGERQLDIESTLKHQMMYPTFPVTLDEMESEFHFFDLKAHAEIKLADVRITTEKLNHPGGIISFRIDYKDKSLVYATDTEHFSCLDNKLLKFTMDSDVLIYDADYTPDEYCGKVGISRTTWGHSTWEAGVEMAMAANVKKLILWHHDPWHDDNFIDEIQREAQKVFKNSFAAYEGMEINLL